MRFLVKRHLALALVTLALGIQASVVAPVSMAQGKTSANTGTLYVSRPSAWVASALSLNITANGKTVGSISDGQCARVILPAGQYTISGLDVWSAFRIRPDSVTVSVRQGSASYVVITPRLIFPGNYMIYQHQVVPSGRRC